MARIEKRGKAYRIIVSCGYSASGKQQRVTKTWTPPDGMTERQIQKEVNRQAVLYEEQVRAGVLTVDGSIKLRDFTVKFLDDYARIYLKATTIRNYERDMERVNASLGHIKLCNLKPAHITKFYASLTRDGANQATGGALEPSTITSINRTLSAVLSKAVKWGYISSNPAALAERPKLRQKEARYLDEPEVRHMLELLQEQPTMWRVMVSFDLFSGLRRGELLGLQWSDVDMTNRTLTVRRTLNYTPGKGKYFDTPKSATSRRPLHLSGTAVFLLQEQRQWQQHRRMEMGDMWQETGLVFTADDGSALFPTSLTTWFRRWIRTTDLPYVNVHSLRHTFASLQISDGVPLVLVSRQLGHAKTSTTANIYTHVIAKSEIIADKTFDKFSDVVENKHQINTKSKTTA